MRQQRRWDEAIGCYQEGRNQAEQIGNRYRVVDNLQDIGITFDLMGQPDRAIEYAQLASEAAKDIEAYYLFARAQRTIAIVLFARGDYSGAFEAAWNACAYITRFDPRMIGESAAKRDLMYEEVVEWVCQLILRLPRHDLVQEVCADLVQRWEREMVNGQHLARLYPGFVTRLPRWLGIIHSCLVEKMANDEQHIVDVGFVRSVGCRRCRSSIICR